MLSASKFSITALASAELDWGAARAEATKRASTMSCRDKRRLAYHK